MKSKSDKDKEIKKTTAPKAPKATPKAAAKPKKAVEDEDEEDDDDEATSSKSAAKTSDKKASGKSRYADDDDEDIDDDADLDDEADDWEKGEADEDFDPDFQEFDMPKSKSKRGRPGTKKEDDDDMGIDEEFKDMGLFDDRFDDDDDDF